MDTGVRRPAGVAPPVGDVFFEAEQPPGYGPFGPQPESARVSGAGIVALADTIYEQQRGIPTLDQYAAAQHYLAPATLRPEYRYDPGTQQSAIDHYVAPDGTWVPLYAVQRLRAVADPVRWVQSTSTEERFKQVGDALRETGGPKRPSEGRVRKLDALIEDALPELEEGVRHLGLDGGHLDEAALSSLAALSRTARGELVMRGRDPVDAMRGRYRTVGRAQVVQLPARPEYGFGRLGASEWLGHRDVVRRRVGPGYLIEYATPLDPKGSVLEWLITQGARAKDVRPMLASLISGGSVMRAFGASESTSVRQRTRHGLSREQEKTVQRATGMMQTLDELEVRARKGKVVPTQWHIAAALFPDKKELGAEDQAIVSAAMVRMETAVQDYWAEYNTSWRVYPRRVVARARLLVNDLAGRQPQAVRAVRRPSPATGARDGRTVDSTV